MPKRKSKESHVVGIRDRDQLRTARANLALILGAEPSFTDVATSALLLASRCWDPQDPVGTYNANKLAEVMSNHTLLAVAEHLQAALSHFEPDRFTVELDPNERAILVTDRTVEDEDARALLLKPEKPAEALH